MSDVDRQARRGGARPEYDAIPGVDDRLLPRPLEGEAPPRLRPALRPAVAAAGLLVSVLVVAYAALRPRVRASGPRWRSEAPLLVEAQQVACGRPHEGVEFRTGLDLFELGDVASAEQCLSACNGNEECKAWAWGEAHSRAAGVCSLKGLGPDERPRRHESEGVVSGLKCSMAEAAQLHAEAARSARTSSARADAPTTTAATPGATTTAVAEAIAGEISDAWTAHRRKKTGSGSSHSGLSTSCGRAADGVDFWTKVPLYQVGGIDSPGACCEACQDEFTCWAWTWGKEDSVPGLANVCFLKGVQNPSEKPKEHPNRDVVSGSVCRTMDDKPVSCDLAPEPAARCDEVEDGVDYWTQKSINQLAGIAAAEDCHRICTTTGGCGAWTWGKESAEDGLARVCFLKGLRLGEEPERRHNAHVESGLLCSFRSFRAIATTTTETATTTEDPRARHRRKGRGHLRSGQDDSSSNSSNRSNSSNSSSSDSRSSNSSRSSRETSTSSRRPDTSTSTSSTTVSTTGDTTVGTTSAGTTSGSTITSTSSITSSSSSSSSSSSTSSITSSSTSSSTISSTSTGSSTTSATTTTTSSTSTLRNTTTREPYHPNSLYCFALMQPFTYEQDLIADQYKDGVSIFDCDEHLVLSSKVIDIAPGLTTVAIDSDLHCSKGGEFMTALNTEIFFAVWDKVISDGRFNLYAWTLKVDPDCVFLPSRLRLDMLHHKEGPTGVYINNCKMGLHGPLEVFSRIAVHLWAAGRQHCVDHFTKLCSGPCLWGEDMFIDQCLSKVLGVRREDDWSLLVEDHCAPPLGWKGCLDVTKAAFHPFKDKGDWRQCMQNAGGYGR